MAHHFTFTVQVTVERISGKFASRADIADALLEEIESGALGADVSGRDVDGSSEYEITDVVVEEVSE